MRRRDLLKLIEQGTTTMDKMVDIMEKTTDALVLMDYRIKQLERELQRRA